MAPELDQGKEKARKKFKRRKTTKKSVDLEIYEKLVDGLRPNIRLGIWARKFKLL